MGLRGLARAFAAVAAVVPAGRRVEVCFHVALAVALLQRVAARLCRGVLAVEVEQTPHEVVAGVTRGLATIAAIPCTVVGVEIVVFVAVAHAVSRPVRKVGTARITCTSSVVVVAAVFLVRTSFIAIAFDGAAVSVGAFAFAACGTLRASPQHGRVLAKEARDPCNHRISIQTMLIVDIRTFDRKCVF